MHVSDMWRIVNSTMMNDSSSLTYCCPQGDVAMISSVQISNTTLIDIWSVQLTTTLSWMPKDYLIWCYLNIGSNNGLVALGNKPLITCTSVDQDRQCHLASLGQNESIVVVSALGQLVFFSTIYQLCWHHIISRYRNGTLMKVQCIHFAQLFCHRNVYQAVNYFQNRM